MKMSVKLLLAPLVGAVAGWLAGYGFNLSPDQQAFLTGLGATLLTAIAHWFEVRLAALQAPPAASSSAKAPRQTMPPKVGGFAAVRLLALLCALCVALVMFGSLSGCATVGAAAPQSLDESLAYGVTLSGSVEQALTEAMLNGTISKATARQVDASIVKARGLLEAARSVESTMPTTATSNLEKALAALNALQAWLADPVGSPPQ